MLLAKLKEERQDNFDGELEAKQVKMKFCTEFQETLLQKSVPAFFVIVSSSLFLKE